MNKIYTRRYYIDKIRGFYHSDLIKVITGIRRCGKSCFMLSVIEDLKAAGVKEKDIIYLNLDKRGYRRIKTADSLEAAIESLITDDDFKYLFIDEVQNVKDFEEVINGFREDGKFSIFITGSNSYLLSGELATKLTGRYIELEMFTLNFREYLEMKAFFGKEIKADKAEEFNEYIRFGGFPKVIEFESLSDKEAYVTDVVSQILDKDVIRHRKIRNRSVFDKLMTYVINNFGATMSLSGIAEYFKKQEHVTVKSETLSSYLQILENAKIIYKCPRFDVKSKKSLRSEQKYYLADLGIYFSRNVDARINYGPVLENIVYTYLSAKNYKISVGRIGALECDFITRVNDEYRYVQVAMTVMSPETEEREYKPFRLIRDNYPKYLLTADTFTQKRDGVIHKNIIHFISNDEDL
ncbi:MAG: ATP-binding protein [Clostridia bacterium]|nr:ATP-binding protein [Clostridia bacterium]MBQ2737650.1 ATP-binding protein [Clostridia bacterium]MBQ8290103.1 ATP-binding protein [Clostridia bacterium]